MLIGNKRKAAPKSIPLHFCRSAAILPYLFPRPPRQSSHASHVKSKFSPHMWVHLSAVGYVCAYKKSVAGIAAHCTTELYNFNILLHFPLWPWCLWASGLGQRATGRCYPVRWPAFLPKDSQSSFQCQCQWQCRCLFNMRAQNGTVAKYK